ncbi:MAG: EAL domain-containing protein [Hyphomicrobiaceae bacterium]
MRGLLHYMSKASLNFRSWRTPIGAFAAALIGAIWVTAAVQISAEHQAMRRTAYHESNNLSLVVAQSVSRTASDLDRILKYLRSSYERNGFKADWPRLVQEEFTAARQSVQIAIMARDGMMITSTKMLYPSKPVDLSDREHYRVHVNSNEDRLFISKPLIGRASKKWSVQFTRRMVDAEGKFSGVIVISLDPSYLTKAYADVDLGNSGGIALIGDDGIVRADGGTFSGLLGQTLPYTEGSFGTAPQIADASIALNESSKGLRVTAVRQIQGFPLKVVIARTDLMIDRIWQRNRIGYLLGASVLTAIVFITMIVSLRRRQHYESKLNQLASFDALTHLSNRRDFHARLSPLLAPGGASRLFAVHVVDLDGFKEINDLYGHPVGDKLLVAVGERIRAATRLTDTVARLGGDEFAVIQCDFEQREAPSILAGRLCTEIARPYTIDGNLIEVGASIGLVEDGRDFEDAASLLRAADLALYSVKSNGRNGYLVYNEHMNEEAQARREIELGLRDALVNNGFDVHYQPIVDVLTGRTTGYEALLRWRHPVRGNISPAEFIPIAEQTGLIVEIGTWILRRACCEIARRSDSLTISVNFSAVQFRKSDITTTVRQVLEETGLAPTRLKVEITESLLLNHSDVTMMQIMALRAIGIQVGIDDFGTGYSSLTYLQNFPVDCVKIDRSFVNNLCSGRNAAAIIKAIVALASGMGMATVAEGVETQDQLEELSALGCHQVQGYLLSKPKPAEEILPPVRSKENRKASLRDVA